MLCTIRTPDGLIYQGDVNKVSLQTELGMMEVEPRHATLLGAVDFSHIVAHTPEGKEVFLGRNGSVYVDNASNHVRLLLTYAEKESSISVTTAKEYLAHIEEQMAKGENLSDFHLQFLEEEQMSLKKLVGKSE